MRRFELIPLFAAGIFHCLACIASGVEVLIHEGPTVSVPGLEMQGHRDLRMKEPPDLRFIKQFVADEKDIPNFRDWESEKSRQTSATRAIGLVLTSLEKDYGAGNLKVVKLESFPEQEPSVQFIKYFLITVNANGSEEHRVVLMNGTVIEPRLKKVE